MDYCSSCRRHLNGALVCPGCGAYAPDIAPRTAAGSVTAGTAEASMAPTAAWEIPAPGTWHDGDLPNEDVARDGTDWTPDAGPYDDVDDAPAAPQGRAARRRQLARWKKNKRRAAVATAVALVGGGLTVASMNRQSPDNTQAATAPDNRSMGVAEKEATEPTDPASTPAATRRTSRGTTTARQVATDLPQQRRHTVATAPRKTLPIVRADSAAAPEKQKAPSTPLPQATTPVTGGTNTDDAGTAVDEASTPSPAPTPTDGADSGTSQTSSSTDETSSSQLCVLVICLG
jgi:hypothetical protein